MNNNEKKYTRRSYEIMGQVLRHGDSVELARRFFRAPQSVTCWSREPKTRKEFASGKVGPLDYLREIISIIRDDDGAPDRAYPLGEYISRLLGGVFVPVATPSKSSMADLTSHLSHVLIKVGTAVDSGSKLGMPEVIEKSSARVDCNKDIDQAIAALMQLKMHINKQKR